MLLPSCAVRALVAFAVVQAGSHPAEPLHVQIDRLIAAGQAGHEKQVAPLASDGEFLRRVTLDLTGTVPTAAEAQAFLADRDPKKREKLIDRLLASPGYARRMSQVFDVLLNERRADSKVPRAAWEDYLRAAFAENRPYDAFARELLAADGVDPKARPAAKFYLERNFEPNLVTRDIARVFLGRNMQCAQCHDHPHIDGYKQADYFGILAFLNRSFLFPNANDAKAVLAEKADGEVNFVSVFDKAKKQSTTLPRVLGGKPVAEPKLEKGKEYKVAPAKDRRPVPAYSRRAQLAKAVTSPDNPAFARTAANRLWALMLGRGIVHPVELDHAGNPPSHPELLDLLTKQFATHKYDVKWLLREIALSRTYQRSSEVPGGVSDPPEDRYLVAALKPLTPEQFAFAMSEATGQTELDRKALGAKVTPTALDARAAGVVNSFRRTFGAHEGEHEDGSILTLDQTLFLKNGATVRGLTQPKAGNLAARLAKQPDDQAADELFLAVLTRRPTAEERADVAAAVKGAANRPAAFGELVWALVASAEFRFNH
jgi:hypothetical protein